MLSVTVLAVVAAWNLEAVLAMACRRCVLPSASSPDKVIDTTYFMTIE